MTKWLLSDLDIHSAFSDGTLPLEEIITLCGGVGFDVIAIPDHLFDHQSCISLELHEEGKSIKNLDSYFRTIYGLSQWAKEKDDYFVVPGLEIRNLEEDYHILS